MPISHVRLSRHVSTVLVGGVCDFLLGCPGAYAGRSLFFLWGGGSFLGLGCSMVVWVRSLVPCQLLCLVHCDLWLSVV